MKGRYSIKNRIKGFGFAVEGLWYFFRRTQNVPIYLVATAIAVGLGIYYHITKPDWLWIVTAIFLMYITEIFNSAIEKVVDKASPEHSKLAKRSKDMAAAGVLMTAILSLIIGIIVFYPYISASF